MFWRDREKIYRKSTHLHIEETMFFPGLLFFTSSDDDVIMFCFEFGKVEICGYYLQGHISRQKLHVQRSCPQFFGWNLKFEKYRLEENKVHIPFIYTHSQFYNGQFSPLLSLLAHFAKKARNSSFTVQALINGAAFNQKIFFRSLRLSLTFQLRGVHNLRLQIFTHF